MAKPIPKYTQDEMHQLRLLFESMFGRSKPDINHDYFGLHWFGAKVQANYYHDGWIVIHIQYSDMPVVHFQTKRAEVVARRFNKWLERCKVIAQKRIAINHDLLAQLKKASEHANA